MSQTNQINRLKNIINQEIADLVKIEKQSHLIGEDRGVVVYFADGVASIEGLTKARIGQKVIFAKSTERSKADNIHNQEIFGQIMDIEPDVVECIVFGEERFIKEGDSVTLDSSNDTVSIALSDELLGKVIDPFCRPVDTIEEFESNNTNSGDSYLNLPNVEYQPIEKDAPIISVRAAVDKPLQTGIKLIDTALPIGKGQRMLIIGDRGTGKTTLALTIFKRQAELNKKLPKNERKILIYTAIGKKISEAVSIYNMVKRQGLLDDMIILLTKANDPASVVYIAPFAATTIAEYFRDKGRDVVIIYDDLSAHANAYRHISLILQRPPGREAYPGDIFYLHSRLLERASNIYLKETADGYAHCYYNEECKGKTKASITAFPIVQTNESDFSAYIPTNIISITDGQIYLDTELANNKIMPAINIGLSVSRIGSKAQNPLVRVIAKNINFDISQYYEKVKYKSYGFDLDKDDQIVVDHGERLIENFKQKEFSTFTEDELVVDIISIYLIKFFNIELFKEEKAHQYQNVTDYTNIIDEAFNTYTLQYKINENNLVANYGLSGFSDVNDLLKRLKNNPYINEEISKLLKKYVKN